MAGEMHTPRDTMACYQPGTVADARALQPRALWAFDAGAHCGDAYGQEAQERQLVHTPSCFGCVKRLRAILIEQGKVQPHERRKGRAA